MLIHTHILSRDEQNYNTITANNIYTLGKVITNIFEHILAYVQKQLQGLWCDTYTKLLQLANTGHCTLNQIKLTTVQFIFNLIN